MVPASSTVLPYRTTKLRWIVGAYGARCMNYAIRSVKIALSSTVFYPLAC